MNRANLTSQSRPLIIERADLQSLGQRWGYGSLTLACWVAWLYFFMPVLSVVAWFAGLTFIYRMLLQGLELAELWTMLARYGVGIGVLVSVYMIWAITSYFRFRGTDRRQAVASVTRAELLTSHHLQESEMDTLQQTNLCTLSAEQLERMFGNGR